MLKLNLGKSQYKLEQGSRHSGKGKTMQTAEDQCLRGVRKEGMNRRSTENFRALKLFCVILQQWIWVMDILVQTHRMYNTKSKS